jgi:periplasmic protein TonB
VRGRRLLGWPLMSSLAVHVAGVTAASSLVAIEPGPPPTAPVAIEVVRLDTPAAPPPPPKRPERITPPRLKVPSHEVAVPSPDAPAPVDDGRRPSAPTPLLDERMALRSPVGSGTAGAPDARLFGAASGAGQPVPGLADAGRLFAKGDVLLPPSGGGDTRGAAVERRVAGIPQETADGGGLTDFARPLGGYQTKPSYPESARRQGIEGVTTLRFQVLIDGHVGRVAVARSAGHAALDRAAMEAVKTWLFEPARRGKETVAVWVTLPVQFRLQNE